MRGLPLVLVSVLILTVLCLFSIPACTSTEVYTLETRVARIETALASVYPPTPTITPTLFVTATPTPVPPSTLTPTPTVFLTPTPLIPSASPTPRENQLVIAGPTTFTPAGYIRVTIRWYGGPARISLAIPTRVGYWGVPGNCGDTCWDVEGYWSYGVDLWMFSTWKYGEVAEFVVTAHRDGGIVDEARVMVTCVGGSTTTPTAVPMPTTTPSTLPACTILPRVWYTAHADRLAFFLFDHTRGGRVWSFTPEFTGLDWEWATRGWLILECGGDCMLWLDYGNEVPLVAKSVPPSWPGWTDSLWDYPSIPLGGCGEAFPGGRDGK